MLNCTTTWRVAERCRFSPSRFTESVSVTTRPAPAKPSVPRPAAQDMTPRVNRARRLMEYAATEALTDAQVHDWLQANAPDVAKEFAIETRRMLEQAGRELSACTARSQGDMGICWFDVSDTLAQNGTPFADLINPITHWAAALFPCCGAEEICRIAERLLTKEEAQALSATFGLGLTQEETMQRIGVSLSTVCRRLRSARGKMVAAARDGRLPKPDDDSDPQKFWESLMQAPPAYRKPCKMRPRKAYVCDCGAHLKLTSEFLDHRKVDSSINAASKKFRIRERILKCRCGKNYPESLWPSIIA